jgi:peroxiredoxin
VLTQSDTLRPGDRAPEFSLTAGNREGTFTLSELLSSGPVVLEFLRGTW